MTLVGIPVEQQDACFRTVAAVLHMGNLEFADGAGEDSSQLAPAAAKHLDACAMLLGVPPDGLLKALTTRTRQTVDGECPHSLLVPGRLCKSMLHDVRSVSKVAGLSAACTGPGSPSASWQAHS